MPQSLQLLTNDYFKRPNARVVVHRMQDQDAIGLHHHDFAELVIILSGRGIHLTEGISYPIAAGEVFVIHPGISHGYADPEKLSLINILIRTDLLREFDRELAGLAGYHALFTIEPALRKRQDFSSRLNLRLSEMEHLCEWVESMEREITSNDPGADFVAVAYLRLIVAAVSRQYARPFLPVERSSLRIAQVLSHMENHYGGPVCIKDLTKVAALSERSLLRAFHDATGHAPMDYLLRLRVRRAAELLVKSNDKITTIAFACGFEDSNYFSRQFRRIIGTTPRDYRSGVTR
ncbi:MAG: helix-turn-helix domain-containing protein [Verrucomicrobiota bacterium]|nr:helix-turn-helix domain-containing protein [Verrucomicrobiota bacterium]